MKRNYASYKKIVEHINNDQPEKATKLLEKIEDVKINDFFNYSDELNAKIFKFLNDTYKPLWKDYIPYIREIEHLNDFLVFAQQGKIDLKYPDEYGSPLYDALIMQINTTGCSDIEQLHQFVALSDASLLNSALAKHNVKNEYAPNDNGNHVLNTLMHAAYYTNSSLDNITVVLHDIYAKSGINPQEYESNYSISGGILGVALHTSPLVDIQKFFADNAGIMSQDAVNTALSNYIVMQLFKHKHIEPDVYEFANNLINNNEFTPREYGLEHFIASTIKNGYGYSDALQNSESLEKALAIKILQSEKLPIDGFKPPFTSIYTAFERILQDTMNSAYYLAYSRAKESIDIQDLNYDERSKQHNNISQNDINETLIENLDNVFKNIREFMNWGMVPGFKMYSQEDFEQMFDNQFNGLLLKTFNRDNNSAPSEKTPEQTQLRQQFNDLLCQAVIAPQNPRKARP